MDAQTIIALLDLRPHPEGGHYIETWRDPGIGGTRGSGSVIYYLLARGERSAWHRIDATETWHWYAGGVLQLSLASGSGEEPVRHLVLGPDLLAGQRPQVTVPAGEWQSARSLGDWSLVGCSVAPAFHFEGFELAMPGWEPGRGGR